MTMSRMIAGALLKRLQARIGDREPDLVIGEDYLRRWFIIPRNWWFNIYLHNIRESDDDRALHDHPSMNLSFILRGGYREHTIRAGGVHVVTERRAGQLKFRLARSAHRLEIIPESEETWTLFISGPKYNHWGFHCPAGWRPWEKFSDPGCE